MYYFLCIDYTGEWPKYEWILKKIKDNNFLQMVYKQVSSKVIAIQNNLLWQNKRQMHKAFHSQHDKYLPKITDV